MKGQSWKKKAMQILCLLSALALFISAQEFAVLAEAVSENDVRMEPGTTANPIHHCTKKDDGSDYTDFSYIYFGSYPKSEVTDRVTIAYIDHAMGIAGAEAETGMDVWINDTKYRRISNYDMNDRDDREDVGSCSYRYFKWELAEQQLL